MGTRNNNIRNYTILLLFVITVGTLLTTFTRAVPTDPVGPQSITVTNTTRLDTADYPPQTVQAEAGNISHLVISAVGVTQSWQGFYGNISGVIKLDDVNENTLYDWQDAEPQGEIYASINSSLTFTDIYCFNYTDANGQPNLSNTEAQYQIDDYDVDGINETFNTTSHPAFDIGTNSILNDTCRATTMYRDDAYQNSHFYNVLLTAPTEQGVVFSTILENRSTDALGGSDLTCFNGEICDFQMLVLEDGHNGSSQDASTTYYFWVEIE